MLWESPMKFHPPSLPKTEGLARIHGHFQWRKLHDLCPLGVPSPAHWDSKKTMEFDVDNAIKYHCKCIIYIYIDIMP